MPSPRSRRARAPLLGPRALPAGALALLAWGAAPAAAAPVELKLWHAYRGQEEAALEAAVDAWDEAHPDVVVLTLSIPPDALKTKFEAAGPRGNGPDLLISAHERVGAWAGASLIAPWPSDGAGLHPAALEALRHGGSLYGLPLATKSLALFVNTALVPVVPRSTDEIAALAGALPPGVYPLAYQATDAYFHAPWMHGFGGGVQDAGQLRLDRPENAAALGFARGMLEAGLLPEEPTGALVTQLFNEGLAATVINGPWFLGEIDPKVNFVVAPLPVISPVGRPAAPYLTVEGLMLSAHAAQPALAVALGAHLTSPPEAVRRAVQGRQTVATLAAYDDPAVAGDAVLQAFRAQMDAAVPMPNGVEMGATWEPSARALRRVMRGAETPEAALVLAQKELEFFTKPPPPAADPTPWLVALGLGLAAALGLALRAARRDRALLAAGAGAYAWVAPAFLSMGLLVLAPFVVGAAVSLFAHHNGAWTFVGLRNFIDILLSRDWPITSSFSFYATLVVTVLWTASNVVLHVGIGVALAMLLREPWLQLRGLYRVLLILPWAVPNYITALIWKGMFHRQFGAINGLLVALGLEPVSWFSRFSTAFAANLLTNTWMGFPFMMVVTLGALQAIPRDLEQAAEVDGASAWQRFRHVILPLLQPALLPAVVLGSVWTFNMFNIIYLVSGGEPDGGTEILISEAYRWAFSRGNRYGYASAYAVLIFGVLLLYSRATDRLLARQQAG